MEESLNMATQPVLSFNRFTLERSLLSVFFTDFRRTRRGRTDFLKVALEFDILRCFPGSGLKGFFLDQSIPVEIERTRVLQCSGNGDVLVTGLLRQGSCVKVLNLKLAYQDAAIKLLVTSSLGDYGGLPVISVELNCRACS
jgi:hypothetical protein